MLSFKEHVNEEYQMIMEKLITFAGAAYPRFGNVVILAGGAGSGKGFVKDKLLGIEGYSFDVDQLKILAIKTGAILRKVKQELDIDLAAIGSDLKNPANVAKLHEIINDYLSIDDKRLKALYGSILASSPDRKPNIIFDVTLKDMNKLRKLSTQVKDLGYDSKRIHIVWVVNDIEVAIAQNKSRERTVPVEILVNTHRGVSATMNDVINMGTDLAKYMDGDIVLAFNKVGVDSDLQKSGRGGMWISKADYIYVKRSGQPPTHLKDISLDIRSKIQSYVPKNVTWI